MSVTYGAGMATEFDPDDVVKQVTESLSKKFPQQDRADIDVQVRQAVNDLKDRPITDYVGVLAERTVKKQLKKN
jgi:phage-related baseplate assembly protein